MLGFKVFKFLSFWLVVVMFLVVVVVCVFVFLAFWLLVVMLRAVGVDNYCRLAAW